jgi:hypothetical protein
LSSDFNKNWNYSTHCSEAPLYKISRWKNVVENYIRKMGIANWRQVVQDRDGWTRGTGGRGGGLSFLDTGATKEKKYIKFIENPSCGSKVVI